MGSKHRHLRGDFLTECEAWLREALASRRWIVVVAQNHNRLFAAHVSAVRQKVPAPGATRQTWGYVTIFVDSQLQNRGVGQSCFKL